MAKKRFDPSQGTFTDNSITSPLPHLYAGDAPNPYLRTFIEGKRQLYDPSDDSYHTEAFTKQIQSAKTSATFSMHMYWTKKPHGAIEQYISHYTQPGNIVLDPMCGSGGTALVALLLGRSAVAIDRSPAATFITKNGCTPFSPQAVNRAFSEVLAKIGKKVSWLYETRCDRCGGSATTSHTVYSQVFKCTRCSERVPYYDCVEAEEIQSSGKAKTIAACPTCFAKGRVEEISTSDEKFGAIPVLVSYQCQNGCSPKRAERRYNDKDAKKRQYFERYDLAKIAEIEQATIPFDYPRTRMMHAPVGQAKWGTLYRQGVASWVTIDEIFTKRNLWALAALRSAIDLSTPLGFVFTAIASYFWAKLRRMRSRVSVERQAR